MIDRVRNYFFEGLLIFSVFIYIFYFSYLTILRYSTLYSSYYDLGIMNQATYNSYLAIKNNDLSRFLEMTDTEGDFQIKRMAIHNDVFLGLISPLYFLFPGPPTLLVLQTVVLGLGALAVFGIAKIVFDKKSYSSALGYVFSLSYLLYTPMQRANIFDFHSVTLTTSFLIFMFYFWLKKNRFLATIFFLLCLTTKEQVGLTTFLFGLYMVIDLIRKRGYVKITKEFRQYLWSIVISLISIIWVVLSIFVIIPYFRGKHHFALEYYYNWDIIKVILNPEIHFYVFMLLGPLAFLSIFSPLLLLISLPDFVINTFSSNGNMHNVIYHYTSVIQPFIFISAIYGAKKLIDKKIIDYKRISVVLLTCAILFSYFKGPLPLSREQEVHPFLYPQPSSGDVKHWSQKLSDDSIKICATGQVAPLFSSRRYLYLFSGRYKLADYVVLRREEIYNYPDKEKLIPVYQDLQANKQFKKIYDKNDLEVYQKIK